jgi:two-component system sensor histidine kinase KdpD
MGTAGIADRVLLDGARPHHRLKNVVRSLGARSTSLFISGLLVVGILACTWITFRFGLNLASVGFLYLVFVVFAAVYGGFWPATLISLLSVACLDYFFNEPIFSFRVDRISDWVELGSFELTALVITQLSNRVQLKAQEAQEERRDTVRLYQAARRILLLDCDGDPGNPVTAVIRETFELREVVLFDGLSGSFHQSGNRNPDIQRRTREAFLTDSDDIYTALDKTWFCTLRLGPEPVGVLALCGMEMKNLTATALASLCAIALERAHALKKQSHEEALRHAEQLRTAVLDALAHKFKTPLTVIRTATSGIPAAGCLSELQTELVSLIDQEAKKLNELASRLLGAPNLDATDFAPQPEPLLLSRLMKAAIEELERQEDRDRFEVTAPVREPAVFADRELILTALAQLVDNAVKYSQPPSIIEAGVSAQDTSVTLTIRSKGLVVAPAEQERIFERFYRAPGAQRSAVGAGLGLSIVKTIANDHHGQVWADGEPDYGTRVSLSLPIVGSSQ